MNSEERLRGRRILVTGAASGIGLATARLFARHGAGVAMVDRDANRLARESADIEGNVRPFVADVADETSVRRAVVESAEVLGGIDGVVNAAGISLRSSLEQTSTEDWRRVMAVNLEGPFLICRQTLPLLRNAGTGTIVNIASGAGLKPIAEFSAYCASKGGLIAFSKALALDLAADGIRVNVICPGIVLTPMVQRRLDAAIDRDKTTAAFLERRAMRRFGTSEEIADAALFLTSGESSFVTGSSLGVDGGAVFH